MVETRDEFESGPFIGDILKWYVLVGGITMGLFMALMVVVVVGVAIGTGSFMGILIGVVIILMVMIPTALLMVGLFFLSAYLLRWIHFSDNKVKLGRTGIQTITVRNKLYPSIKNKIPYDRIVRIEEGTDGYIQHIREKTPKWYYAMTLLHRIPHAGLYIPLTSPKNLLVIYLDRPIEITNNNMKNILYRGLKIEKHPVTEVIIDVESSRHEEFIDTLDWYLRNSQMHNY